MTAGPDPPPGEPADSPSAAAADPAALLAAYLRDRDVECPRCTYNLRNLQSTECPECREPLQLHVTTTPLPVGYLLATVAPGFFCGILLLIFLFLMVIFGAGPGPLPLEVDLLLLFGFLSGLAAIGISTNARRFMRLDPGRQLVLAVTVWIMHLFVFLLIAAA